MDMTATDNIRQQYRVLGVPSDEGISDLLCLVGLENTGNKKVKNFSLGMRQRLGIAVALAGNPDFLVLDEPVNGLDPQGIIEMRELILKLNREHGITVLISSHILDELARLATHYGFIDSGYMIREMSAEELEEKLELDTNTLLSISSGDRAVRILAARINAQLRGLRKERLRLQNGDAELKTAITNISHDLRTPLSAICGYLDLLEQENHTENSRRYLAVIRERTDAMNTLTEELFRYSIITSTTEDLRFEILSLNDILEQSLSGCYGVLTKRGITPDIRMPEKPVMRKLDKNALRREF